MKVLSSSWWERFGSTVRLYGSSAMKIFANTHFCVVGIGGVGSWVVEALARTGIGKITLIDMDDICITNTNRQIQALQGKIGQAKITVMAERILDINPECNVICIHDFITPDNTCILLSAKYDYVIDAIDGAKVKAALIYYCYQNKIPLITVGGAGGKIDPTQIQVGDLANAVQDPLASKLREQLKNNFSMTKNSKGKLKVDCVFSTESPIFPKLNGPKRMDCASGFGAAVMVTATFGFIAVSHSLKKIISYSGG